MMLSFVVPSISSCLSPLISSASSYRSVLLTPFTEWLYVCICVRSLIILYRVTIIRGYREEVGWGDSTVFKVHYQIFIVAPCIWLKFTFYFTNICTCKSTQDTRSQYKEEQVTRNPTPSHVQYDMLPTYFKNNYRLKVTLLGTNLLPVDGFI